MPSNYLLTTKYNTYFFITNYEKGIKLLAICTISSFTTIAPDQILFNIKCVDVKIPTYIYSTHNIALPLTTAAYTKDIEEANEKVIQVIRLICVLLSYFENRIKS